MTRRRRRRRRERGLRFIEHKKLIELLGVYISIRCIQFINIITLDSFIIIIIIKERLPFLSNERFKNLDENQIFKKIEKEKREDRSVTNWQKRN